MARLLPFRPSDRAREPREPRLVDIGDEEADAVFAALSAETARDILGRLYREPGTATDVAEAADTSLQNARYHLEKLQSAGLVEPVDTWYSSRGTEMTVYAPTSEPLVVAAGPDEQTSILRSALGRLVGALGVLGVASLLVDRLVRMFSMGGTAGDGGDQLEGDAEVFAAGRDAPSATATPTPQAQEATAQLERTVVAERTAEAPGGPFGLGDLGGLFDPGAGLPPGGLFFLGGLLVLAAVGAWWYWRRYRPLYG